MQQVAQGKEVELALQKFTKGKNGSQHFAPKLLSRFIVRGEQHGFFWLRTNNVWNKAYCKPLYKSILLLQKYEAQTNTN